MTEPLGRRLIRTDAPDAEEVLSLVALVGERLQRRFEDLNDSMNTAIEETVQSLDDPELTRMLHASVEGNVATILHVLRNDIPLENVQPITAATEYAIRLARAGVPATSLRRAYHIGSDDLLAHVFEEIQALDCSPEVKLRLLHHLAGWMHKYVDWITQIVVEAHERERAALLEQSASETSQLVQRVLAREQVRLNVFESKTGYRLDQTHVGVVLWVEGVNQGADQTATLRAFAARLAGTLASTAPPLFTPVDRSTAWVWVAVGAQGGPVDLSPLRSDLEGSRGLRVALGKPAPHVTGFRRTHEQAIAVRVAASVGATPRSRAVFYGEDGMAIVAMLARDLPATRRWVTEVLGPLAADTEPAERLRDTVRVYLRTGSLLETAERLVVHRNTVKYRLNKAEQERGRPLSDGRLDLELALHVCHVLGRAVLRLEGRPSDGPPA